MAHKKAVIATGLTLKKASDPVEWNITDVAWNGHSIAVLDGSHMGSVDWMEKVLGILKDPGALSFTVQVTEDPLPVIDSTYASWEIKLRSGQTLTGQASVTAVGLSASVEQIQTATVDLTFEGAITFGSSA